MKLLFASKMRCMRLYVKCKDVILSVIGFFFLFCMGVGVYHIGCWCYNVAGYCYHAYILDDVNDSYNYSRWLNRDFTFYENGSHGYIRNRKTQKKVLKDVSWVAESFDEDSLLCFASKGYRGYFNRKTGKVAIPALRYKMAWVFSEGLAAVMEEDSTLKFINTRGEVVIDKGFKYAALSSGNQGYLFKNGYCVMNGYNHRWGLIDKEGQWAVLPEYDRMPKFTSRNCWICYGDNGKQGLLNDSLRLVLPPVYREVLVTDRGIEVLKEDYTRQLLDFEGNVLEPCLYTDIRDLYYVSEIVDPSEDEYEYTLTAYKVYQTTYSYSGLRVGLMGPDGKPVTPPLYSSIEAVSQELFRCFYDDAGTYYEGEGASVIINKHGRIIEAEDPDRGKRRVHI